MNETETRGSSDSPTNVEEINNQIERVEDKIDEIEQTPENERDTRWTKQFQALNDLLAGLTTKLDDIATKLESNQTTSEPKPDDEPEADPEPVLEVESTQEIPQRRSGRNPKRLKLKRAQPR
jgi:hypothetical protein